MGWFGFGKDNTETTIYKGNAKHLGQNADGSLAIFELANGDVVRRPYEEMLKPEELLKYEQKLAKEEAAIMSICRYGLGLCGNRV